MLRRALSEKIIPRSGFVVGEAVRRPLRVVYADHSRLEHHGVAAGGAAAVLTGAFEPGRGARRKRREGSDACGLISILECVKFPPWGRVSAPTGVAPEALEEC